MNTAKATRPRGAAFFVVIPLVLLLMAVFSGLTDRSAANGGPDTAGKPGGEHLEAASSPWPMSIEYEIRHQPEPRLDSPLVRESHAFRGTSWNSWIDVVKGSPSGNLYCQRAEGMWLYDNSPRFTECEERDLRPIASLEAQHEAFRPVFWLTTEDYHKRVLADIDPSSASAWRREATVPDDLLRVKDGSIAGFANTREVTCSDLGYTCDAEGSAPHQEEIIEWYDDATGLTLLHRELVDGRTVFEMRLTSARLNDMAMPELIAVPETAAEL